VHAIERHNLDHLPGEKLVYAARTELGAQLKTLVGGAGRVAMEYSPGGAIPYIGLVDAGTVEAVRACGVEVVSSGDLVQRFATVWDRAAQATHNEASVKLHEVKDRAFAWVAARVKAGDAITEYDVQQQMVVWFRELGLVSDSAPIVGAQEHAGNPHYQPAAGGSRRVGRDDLLLLDLWGKLDREGAVYADITWVGFAGTRVPDEFGRAFAAIAAGRDAAVDLIQTRARTGQAIRGFEVDRLTRQVITDAGFGSGLLHRTGHSLGESVHGNGVNMDDYETHDDRRLLPGSAFTIEPGVYYPHFGVRTEINMVMGTGDASVSGPRQAAIVALL
jgi:Xaa-Pro aminopeptidase